MKKLEHAPTHTSLELRNMGLISQISFNIHQIRQALPEVLTLDSDTDALLTLLSHSELFIDHFNQFIDYVNRNNENETIETPMGDLKDHSYTRSKSH